MYLLQVFLSEKYITLYSKGKSFRMFRSKSIRFSARTLFITVLIFSSCKSHRQVVLPPVSSPMQQTVVEVPVVQNQPVQEETGQSAVQQIPETWESRTVRSLDSICNSQLMDTAQLGIYVYDLTSDTTFFSYKEKQRLRPASCQKLVTSISALEYLGGEYKFCTDFRVNGQIAGGTLTGDLYVVGGMDPLLSKNELKAMALNLQKAGISRIKGHLYVDLSMKDDLEYGWGWCWDDDYGPLSALTVDGKNTFVATWLQCLQSAGISLSSRSCTVHMCPPSSISVGSITHSFDEVLVPMMKESDNIYAESMFYQIAAHSGQKNAGRKEAAGLVNDFITRLGLQPDNYRIADGSGLSLYNYVSPLLLVSFLRHAWLDEKIRTHLYPALPVGGVDGTLEKRMLEAPLLENVHAKTGTVDGVSTLSGYLTAGNGHFLAFSIMNQGIARSSIGKDFQDKVCAILCK